MRTDTALAAFCVTTLTIIVGLVAMTATQMGITNPAFTGNYYVSTPEIGQATREYTPMVPVEVDPTYSRCYSEGVAQCGRLNAGQNFISCAQKVTVDCGKTHPTSANCFLPPGFELKYRSSRDCVYGVVDECRIMCSSGLQEACNRYSNPRCKLIGGKFSSIYEQEKFTSQGELSS
jgi:hypothetical protein